MNEQRRLERLRALFGAAPPLPGVEVGIGDDAAVLAPGDEKLVWTVDATVEGVHFRREWLSLEDVGWRSLMGAASDLGAMGASPRGVLSAIILPDGFVDDELEALARGQAQAARAIGTAVVGGNLSRGGELSITTSVLGTAKKPLLRRGALEGDVVAMVGAVGLSGAGLEALRRGADDRRLAIAIEAYRRPKARIAEGLVGALVGHAAIDVSDGLALDVSRLAAESGVGVVLEEANVLAAGGIALTDAATALSLHPLELALHAGEDYALIVTFGAGTAPAPFVRVGRCVRGVGIFLESANGALREIEPRGFDHFQ